MPKFAVYFFLVRGLYHANIPRFPLHSCIASRISLAAGVSCDSLAALTLPDTAITLAQQFPAGPFVPADLRLRISRPFAASPRHLKPVDDSEIKIEVWMPESGWNGKFLGVGNGGWSGAISYPGMGQALKRGYATASTNTGHDGPGGDASFALGHPEKLIDFAYRAVHEMTVKGKAIIAAYYGNGARLSYWNGCSSGGKQGLKEAQRFPRDYDGIVAGAPANYWTHLMAGDLWPAQATLKDAASYIPKEKYALIHRAVLEQCDALDGVKDGVLEDPRLCRFDPKLIQCSDADAPTCLTPAQAEAARKIYAGPHNPRTGKQVFPGLAIGSELTWGALAGGPSPFQIVDNHFKYIVFKDPKWDFRTLNFDKDIALADKVDNNTLNAIDPNLREFTGHGGKLILYHGWNDQLIAPENSIDYYESVLSAMGGMNTVGKSVRLFMAPGMTHCAGGAGPDKFDSIGALEQWVEAGKPPDRLVASHATDGKVDRTRPLCPYPQIARYRGTGSTDDANNFVCRTQAGSNP